MATLWLRQQPAFSSDSGSIAPLGIGLAALSLGVVLTTLSAGSLYLTDRRLTSVAESAALSVLSEQGDLENLARDFLNQHPLSGLHNVELVEASKLDGKTVRVRLCASAVPLIGYVFSETGRVCSEGLARRGR
ncbi:MAG: pilus assembly protein TadG-related protein [Actinomycetota bacterium]